jgi:hypothetical protein
MASVASGGTAERIAARILFKALRAGSGTPTRYSSTFFGARLPLAFAAELRVADFDFFMRAMLQEAPIRVYALTRRAAGKYEKCQRVLRNDSCEFVRCALNEGEEPAGRRRYKRALDAKTFSCDI